MSSVVCPVCKQIDKVDSVSAIVAAGTLRLDVPTTQVGSLAGHVFSATVYKGATATTGLADILRKPAPPEKLALEDLRQERQFDTKMNDLIYETTFMEKLARAKWDIFGWLLAIAFIGGCVLAFAAGNPILLIGSGAVYLVIFVLWVIGRGLARNWLES